MDDLQGVNGSGLMLTGSCPAGGGGGELVVRPILDFLDYVWSQLPSLSLPGARGSPLPVEHLKCGPGVEMTLAPTGATWSARQSRHGIEDEELAEWQGSCRLCRGFGAGNPSYTPSSKGECGDGLSLAVSQGGLIWTFDERAVRLSLFELEARRRVCREAFRVSTDDPEAIKRHAQWFVLRWAAAFHGLRLGPPAMAFFDPLIGMRRIAMPGLDSGMEMLNTGVVERNLTAALFLESNLQLALPCGATLVRSPREGLNLRVVCHRCPFTGEGQLAWVHFGPGHFNFNEVTALLTDISPDWTVEDLQGIAFTDCHVTVEGQLVEGDDGPLRIVGEVPGREIAILEGDTVERHWVDVTVRPLDSRLGQEPGKEDD